MAPALHLTLTDYVDPTRWRWVLKDARGRFLADHTVWMDPTSREYRGFLDLASYLDYHQPISPPEKQLAALGGWIGEQVFGGLRNALWKHRASPAVAIHVTVPQAAQVLLFRPFELACFADGKTFREAGLRFVYRLEGTPDPVGPKEPTGGSLRILAVFSLPVRLNPLNLRRERYGLQRLVRELNQTQGLAIELRVLQYGATRDTLREALEEAEGWDVIHLSGHGERGELLLEDERGGSDTINADDLGDLLDMARQRIKLLILDMCYSGAGSHAAARVQVGLDKMPMRQEGAKGESVTETSQTALPSLGQALAQRLDCAALAMRYPVGDAFATELMLALYEKLLDKRRPLPAALHLALKEALAADIPRPALSWATPILLGPRAADLQLTPPQRASSTFSLPKTGLGIAFPSEPERFVGRLQPMLRASQALAPRGLQRGVVFYGMPGAGKTACALELANRHSEGRFQGYVWYQAPEEGRDIAAELSNALFEIERQLDQPGLLAGALDDPERFRQFTLPRLRDLLQRHSLLLVLDNLETLLTDSGGWRDPLWGDFVTTLIEHTGPSRVVITTRRLPADLAKHPRVLAEAIHALSFAESVLLARDLPHLKRLFNDEAGLELLRKTLRVVQGHPKLLQLADGLAADRATLEKRVATAEDELAHRGDVLDAFFAAGVNHEGETRQTDDDLVAALQGWTASAVEGLPGTARLLFAFLCRLEPPDRHQWLVQTVWKNFLTRLSDNLPAAKAAMAEPEQGLPVALVALESASLLEIDHLENHSAQITTYSIHPGVAEITRTANDPVVLDAADIELGNFYVAMYHHSLKDEMQGGSRAVAKSARLATPYLMRQARWAMAAHLLQEMTFRDDSLTTLAFAEPLLRRIVKATDETEQGLSSTGVLADVLFQVGRTPEAEQLMRDCVTRAVAQGNYYLASSCAGDLVKLLMRSGRLSEALAIAEDVASYTRQAGLGPWTQLTDQGIRLQVLAAMGRNNAVLAAVESLRPLLDTLPIEDESNERVTPWNVREALMDTGRTAALNTQCWEKALTLNAEIVNTQQERGADALQVARTRFNDYAPLLRLGRNDEARQLLLGCRIVFEEERDLTGLGVVYSALADLEDKSGDQAAVVRFEETALDYKYQVGNPERCAGSHHNLANYLANRGSDPATVLAHRLAAATIRLQTQSGQLPPTLKNLSITNIPTSPPAFATVVTQVEVTEGVRFQSLFERLPRTAPNGDAAIAIVCQLAEEKKAEVLHDLEPLLQVIAAVAKGNDRTRAAIESGLPWMEANGWKLADAVQRIWAGERDAEALTASIDSNSAQLVLRVLQLIAQ